MTARRDLTRVPITDGRSALEMAGVAVRRVDEQRKWQDVRARRDGERAPLDAAQRRAWAALSPSPKLLTALTPTPWSAATPTLRVSR